MMDSEWMKGNVRYMNIALPQITKMARNKRKEEEDSVLLCDQDTVYTEKPKGSTIHPIKSHNLLQVMSPALT